jgi:hypothetical protein
MKNFLTLRVLLRHSLSTSDYNTKPIITGAYTILLILARTVCVSLFKHVGRDLLIFIGTSDSLPYAIIRIQ